MKKITSMLVLMVMLLGIGIPVSAVPTKAKVVSAKPVVVKLVESALRTGIIKAFTENSVTVLENGKTYVLPLAKNSKIEQAGEAVDLMEMAKKGLKVHFKAMLKGNALVSLTYIDIPAAGSLYEGIFGTSCSNEVNSIFSFKDASIFKVTKNLNSMIEANKLEVTKNFVTDKDDFEINGKNTLFVGNYDFVPDTMKLTIAGKDIKITDKAFDATVGNDEAMFTKNKAGELSLTLEAALTDGQIANKDTEIKLSYKINEYNMQRYEVLNLLVNEDVYSELNGKEVSYTKAMYRGNYFVAGTNEKDEIVSIDAYYRDLKCTLESIKDNKITVTVIKNGNPAFIDTLVLNEGCTVTDSAGQVIEITSIQKGSQIMISNNPDANYQVISIVSVE